MATEVDVTEAKEVELKAKFIKLCKELNIDDSMRDGSWIDFQKINRNVTLEGDLLHWLVCALYVTCRKASVLKEQLSLEPNNISLSKTLHAGNLSLLHFFNKVRKWLEMGKQHTVLNEQIEQLERNFSVSSIVYEKFVAIFNDLYNEDWTETIKRSRGSKKTSVSAEPMTTKNIFDFCWTLYIRAKAQYPDICDDLVNSYHLLLCCVDLVFANTASSKQLKTAINTEFQGLPKDFLIQEYTDSPSIIDTLCQLYEGLMIETKIIRRQYLHAFLDDLIKNNQLKGNVNKRIDVIDPTNFEYNLSYLNDSYEKHILQKCDIDERIFIRDDSTNQIGTPTKRLTAFTDVDEKESFEVSKEVNGLDDSMYAAITLLSMQSQVKRNLQEYFNKAKGFVPETPLTGRRWLEEKNISAPSPSKKSITQSACRLQELLKGLKATPNDNLKSLFQGCKENPENGLIEKITSLSLIFLEEYSKPLDVSCKNNTNVDNTNKDFAKARLHLAKVLFYKTLENFLAAEKKKNAIDLSGILQQDIFIKCLFTCCLEIVIFSYNSSRVFPWILNAFNLKPYHFFKVIELVIRGEDLSRDVIKHLSRIEEQILESLSWQTNSPVFESIKNSGIPKCQDVASDTGVMTPLFFMSPTTVRMSKDAVTQQSPIVSLKDRFGPSTASPAKRNLFGSPQKIEASPVTPVKIPPMKQQTAVVLPPKTTATTVRFPIMLTPGASPLRVVAVSPQRGLPPRGTPPRSVIRIQASPNKSNASKKFGSLGIFFRKLYHMTSIRLKDLCDKLNIGAELHRKIWTCFEHSLLQNIEMLRDRHIDQLIMCAIYVMSKVTKEDQSFHDIMKWYRTQPQATSDVYRNVMIERASDRQQQPSPPNNTSGVTVEITPPATDSNSTKENNTAPQQTNKDDAKTTASETSNGSNSPPTVVKEENSEETSLVGDDKNVYNDLIQFYNIVYIKKIKDFALKFASNKVTLDAPPLSPLPVSRKQVHSPRQISKQHQIYISPIKPTVQMTPRSKMLYCFDSDSPKKLDEINAMIKGGTRRRVILDLDDNNTTGPSPAKRPMNGLAKRAQELRQEQLGYRVLNNHK